MPSQWIVKRGEQEQGPFTSPQLRQLAHTGKLRTTDQIRKQDCEKYVPAEKVKGLFDSTPPISLPTLIEPAKTSEIPVAEIVEVIEDELPIVLEAAPEDAGASVDFQEYEYSYDEYPVVDYVDSVEYEVPAASLRRSSNRNRPLQSARDESCRPRSESRPTKRGTIKKVSSDEELGRWEALFGGMGLIALGIFLFVFIGDKEVEIEGWGIVTWIMMGLNKIGGRWAMMIFFVACGIACICHGISKFVKR